MDSLVVELDTIELTDTIRMVTMKISNRRLTQYQMPSTVFVRLMVKSDAGEYDRDRSTQIDDILRLDSDAFIRAKDKTWPIVVLEPDDSCTIDVTLRSNWDSSACKNVCIELYPRPMLSRGFIPQEIFQAWYEEDVNGIRLHKLGIEKKEISVSCKRDGQHSNGFKEIIAPHSTDARKVMKNFEAKGPVNDAPLPPQVVDASRMSRFLSWFGDHICGIGFLTGFSCGALILGFGWYSLAAIVFLTFVGGALVYLKRE